MGCNQVQDKNYEKLMKDLGKDELLADWKKHLKNHDDMSKEIYRLKGELITVMLAYASAGHRKRRIEEDLYRDNKSVL